MNDMSDTNPFEVGDRAVFLPDRHTVGWHQHSLERIGLVPGDEFVVTAVVGDRVETHRSRESSMHFSQFQAAAEVPVEERLRARSGHDRRKSGG